MRTLLVMLMLTLPALADTKPEEEIARLKKELKAAQNKAAQLARERDLMRDKAVAAEISAKSLKERLDKIELKLAEVVKELAKRRGKAPAAAPGTKPAENVEGKVEKVEGKLVSLSVGSDAGLKKGDTLEVFRLDTPPKYLGRVKVVEVSAKRSAAQAVGKMVDTPKEGDKVASPLLGK
jgi:hypothetical protein